MKKVLFFVMLLFPILSGTAFVNAQVRIGANVVREKGTVLDLKSSSSAGYIGGLLLPRVSLASLTSVPASWIGAPGSPDYSKLKGLLVYNTNTAVGAAGIYVWDGTKWLAVITA